MATDKIITGNNIKVLLYSTGFYMIVSMVINYLLYIHKKIISFLTIFILDRQCCDYPVYKIAEGRF
jgi:hypothetical protein